MKGNKRIFLLIGPSGSGKTSLGECLKELGIPELTSHTTRKMREGEVDGLDYHFVTKEEFDKIEKVEYSEYAGNYYCLSKQELESKIGSNNQVFIVVDMNGANQIKAMYPEETIKIFIEASLDDLVERMRNRGDAKENIAKRISNAILDDELYNGDKCDYIIENKDLKKAKQALKSIAILEVKYKEE